MYLLYIIIYYSVNTLIILNIRGCREMFEVDIYVCEMLVYTG